MEHGQIGLRVGAGRAVTMAQTPTLAVAGIGRPPIPGIGRLGRYLVSLELQMHL